MNVGGADSSDSDTHMEHNRPEVGVTDCRLRWGCSGLPGFTMVVAVVGGCNVRWLNVGGIDSSDSDTQMEHNCLEVGST